ncbi:hypothetical protein Z517_01633 [Fonsecaea pedrosoi CBS 271.37]|uniref:Nephrocystin 3-like N-terminal domain-containing protein n=1 Tax=Fonsecaea pedrosoi CBS 271.37 TaxID=1442368 RepID=A0A0D2GYU7_9EURO|nr:uncharacterized protein Z517_01633 [Fonsecaea pedrosoi CBS 271.37]KIW86238.1 hypothetical protein Z517_01633 [Fonsecaea pedrosoi CBS 271.37]
MAYPVTAPDTLAQDFDNAGNEFLASLSPGHSDAFQGIDTPEDLRKSTAELMTTFQVKKKLATKTQHIVADLIEALVSYFEVLNLIITQDVTTYAATVWGSIFLILKVASPFPALFDRLAVLLADVSTCIPQYRKLLELIGSDMSLRGLFFPSDKLNWSLRALYRHIFGLFGDIARVFAPNDQHELIRRIERWLSAPSYVDALNRASSLRQSGTADWLFEHQAYKSWSESSREEDELYELTGPVLWIRGDPGTGKTILAAATIVNLKTSVSTNHHSNLLSYYFFDQGYPSYNTIRSAYASMLSQALTKWTQFPSILDLFSFAMTRRTQGQDHATVGDMADIIKLLRPLFTKWYMIIDAVDECESPEAFLKYILDLESRHGARVLLFGRPNVSFLGRNVPESDRITVTSKLVNPDLRRFFSEHLTEMVRTNFLDHDTNLEELVGHLLTGADGTFQWAQLMVAYLKSEALPRQTRPSLIRRLRRPERLEDMYMRILTAIVSRSRVEQFFARRMFMWILFGKGVGRLDQLEDLLQTLRERTASSLSVEEQRASASILDNFEPCIVRVCSGLVEVRWSHALHSKICRFAHSSVYEFFQRKCSRTSADADGMGVTGYLHPSAFEAESELLIECFRYHQAWQHQESLSAHAVAATSSTYLDDTRPFLRYATLDWRAHLVQPPDAAGTTLAALLQALGGFLADSSGMVSWVEALYTYRADIRKINDGLGRWASKASTSYSGPYSETVKQTAQQVLSLVKDLGHLDKVWRAKLSRNPALLRSNISAFSKSAFFAPLRTVAPATVVQVAPTTDQERISSLSSAPLCQISREKPGGGSTATLKIWCPAVSSSTKAQSSSPTDGVTNAIYCGWIAQFEIWATAATEPVLIQRWDFPLDEREVSCHMAPILGATIPCGGSVKAPSNEAGAITAFPMSIGKQFDLITVLYTVYVLDRQQARLPNTGEPNIRGWLRSSLPIGCDARSLSVYQPVGRGVEDRRKVFTTTRPASSHMFTHNDLVIYQGVSNSNYDQGLGHYGSRVVNGSCFMAIFQARANAVETSIETIAILDGLDFANVFNSCSFHPTLPLVALIWHTRTLVRSAALWSFASPSVVRRHGVNIVTPVDFQDGNGMTTCEVLVDCGPIARVQFSGCGNRVLVDLLPHRSQGLVDLRDTPTYHAAVAEHERSQEHRVEQRPGHTQSPWPLRQGRSRRSGPANAKQQDGVAGSRDASFAPVAPRLGQNVQTMGLPNHNVSPGGDQMVPRSQPASEIMEPCAVIVQSPATRQDKIDFSPTQVQELCQNWPVNVTSSSPPPHPMGPPNNIGARALSRNSGLEYQCDRAPTARYTMGELTTIPEPTVVTEGVQAREPAFATIMDYDYCPVATPFPCTSEANVEPSSLVMWTDTPVPAPLLSTTSTMDSGHDQAPPTPHYDWVGATVMDEGWGGGRVAEGHQQQSLYYYAHQNESPNGDVGTVAGPLSSVRFPERNHLQMEWQMPMSLQCQQQYQQEYQDQSQTAPSEDGVSRRKRLASVLDVSRGHGRVWSQGQSRGQGEGQGQNSGGRVVEAAEATAFKRICF